MEAAADGITAALDALQVGRAMWRQADSTSQHLLRLSGRGQQRTSELPGELADLLRRLERTHAEVPAPAPAPADVHRR